MTNKASRKILIIISFMLMVAVMLGSIIGLHNYVEKSIHKERTNYLTAQTKSVAGLVDKITNQYLDYARICEKLISAKIEEEEEEEESVSAILDELNYSLDMNNARLILVDKNCIWYGEDNTSGRITAIEEYTSSTPAELIYMTTGVDVNIESICYRIRLQNPGILLTENGPAEICYCTIIYYMDQFDIDLAEAFPYHCNGFIVDENGLMLYKNFRMGVLISGTNLFAKYEKAEFLYGDNGEELLNMIKQRSISVGEMKISDTNYFICTAPLSINNWSLSFVIDTDELSSGEYLSTLIRYITVMAFVFAISAITAILLLIRANDDKKLIEKKQKANELLTQASNAKSAFIANMSHDIRTPINGIMGMTAIAMDEDISPKAKDCLCKIDISSRYLLSLVNDVLDMSSLENEGFTLNNENTDLRRLLDDCMVIINSKLLGRTLVINQNFEDADGKYVITDQLRLKQVLINILSNAVKFTSDDGSIEFNVTCTDQNKYSFSIKDSGIGMEEEFVKHIWDRFSQGNGGARSEYKGTGLGMAISKSIVDAMGGQILVDSKQGKGTKFTVILDMQPGETPKKAETGKAQINSLNNKNILIAEDNDINMEIAIEILSSKGAVADPAEDGKIAYNKYISHPAGYYDLILMDIMMPNMNGLECVKAIRSSGRDDAASIPIIAMSANTDSQSIKDAMNAGMSSYVYKPLDISAVLTQLNQLLAKE